MSMSMLRRLLNRVRPGASDALDREVDEEIRFHIEMRERANLAAGMAPAEARRAAERTFGDRHRVHEAARTILAGAPPARDGAAWYEVLWQDVRFGARMLERHRLTTSVAVLSLAIGIGINIANFSIAYGLIYRPLPFERGNEVLYVDTYNTERSIEESGISWAILEQLRGSDLLSAAAAFDDRSFTVTGGDRPERLAGAVVTPDLFPLLGIDPILGRHFEPGEGAEAGFEPVALISHSLWQRRYAADPGIIGRSLQINGREVTLIGVMPAGFRFPERHDLWLPLGTDDATDRARRFMIGVARLESGVTLAQVSGILDSVAAANASRFPDTDEGWGIRAQAFRDGFFPPEGRQLVMMILGAVGFVLLLACANVANLMLARAADRERELTVRAALGAGRGRLLRQMLTESVLLGLLGGVLGLVIAQIWLAMIWGAIPDEFAYWVRIEVDRVAAAYMIAVSIGTGLLFGSLPAWKGARPDLVENLKEAGRRVAGAGRSGRVRSALVVGEMTLAVVLLTSSYLMVQSFMAMQDTSIGLDEEHLLSMRVSLAGDRYDEPRNRTEYFRAVTERLASLPGIEAATVTSGIPADDGGPPVSLLAEGDARSEQDALSATAVLSTSGFFEAIGSPLLTGREFTLEEMFDRDAEVVIIGRSLADRLWPGESPLGRRLRVLELERDATVVGVAADLIYEEISEETERSRLQLHLPYGVGGWRGMALLVRTDGDPALAINDVRDELVRIDPLQAPYDILTMADRRAFTIWPQRALGQSFALFGLFALVLAVCGVYAVIAYAVSSRTHEMGVRMALGAPPADVRRLVIWSALRIAGAGVVLGLALAAMFARGLEGFLYGVSARDPLAFAGVALVLLLAAAVAAALPARRASRIDPTEALRAD
jgi:putative ABC transport system permease protein